MSVQDVVKEIKKLSTQKATQSTDIPVKILKENSDIFRSYICDFFNDCVERGDLPSISKLANITPVFKKEFKGSKDNYRAFFQSFLKYLKNFFVNKLHFS